MTSNFCKDFCRDSCPPGDRPIEAEAVHPRRSTEAATMISSRIVGRVNGPDLGGGGEDWSRDV